MIHYPENLPIVAKKEEIINTIDNNRVTIVIGEAGSGKTTQLPKMCLELAREARGLIGCTQPRRMAAVMAARRIALELGEDVGQQVGYKIRFDEKSGCRQRIKIMTDGILLMEAQTDPLLRRYDTIILDEAHERSLNIDFLLGIIKKISAVRPHLKVIITSATIDALKFSQFFDRAPIVEVSGRLYPVETFYRPVDTAERADLTHIEMAVQTADEIISYFPPGDILVFMPTEADIRDTCALFQGRYGPDTLILPFFARLTRTEQERVFRPCKERKIIVATNIAETSLTIAGTKYVIDSGLGRISEYNPRTKTTSLPIRAISASSADQRKGRCGRLQDGACFRLYSEEDYHRLPLFTPPELQRSNLAEVILRMLYLDLGEPAAFPFLDPPPLKTIQDGLDTLLELKAIVYADPPVPQANQQTPAVERQGRQFKITPQGRMMARLPLDPRLSRMIIEAKREKCLPEVLIIAAALTIQHPREIPLEDAKKAAEIHRQFQNKDSDFLGLLKLYQEFDRIIDAGASKTAARKFCRDRFLSYRRMQEWRDIVEQLNAILTEHGIKIESTLVNDAILYEKIHKSIISGYLSQIAYKKKKNLYQAARGREVHIFPGSDLYNSKGAKWIVVAEMVETSRLYARRLARVESHWVEELGKNLCRYSYQNPRWDSRRKEVVADQQVSLYGLIIVPRRQVSYGPVDPQEAADVFIREALMAPEEPLDLPFLHHNIAVIERIRSWEDKLRRRDILVGEAVIFQFYRQRLPEIYSLKSLQKLIRQNDGDAFLRMQEADLLQRSPQVDPDTYPDQVLIDQKPVDVSYLFAHGNPADGVTLKLPLEMLARLPNSLPESLIPGLWQEKVWQLLKGLPKEWRKRLHPLKEKHQFILRGFNPSAGPLTSELSRFLWEQLGVEIPASVWPTDKIEEYLKMRIAVMGDDGTEHFASRDLAAVRAQHCNLNQHPAFIRARESWEREGLLTWNFPDLPDQIPLEHMGRILGDAFPGLSATGQAVALRLFINPREAARAHSEGLIALYQTHLAEHFVRMRRHLALRAETKIWAATWQDIKTLTARLQKQITKELTAPDIRKADDFFRQADEMKGLILPKAQEILGRIEPLLKAFYEAAIRLERLKSQNRDSRPALAYLVKLEGELKELLPPDFMDRFDRDRYECLMRFMKGLAIRAERGLVHLERAWEKTREVDEYVQLFAQAKTRITAGNGPENQQAHQAIDELFWMIEEYKISLFAQELKTRFPVSKKRLEMGVKSCNDASLFPASSPPD